jgi:hypothetical protein
LTTIGRPPPRRPHQIKDRDGQIWAEKVAAATGAMAGPREGPPRWPATLRSRAEPAQSGI